VALQLGPVVFWPVFIVGGALIVVLNQLWYRAICSRGGPNAHRMPPWKTIPAALRFLREP
jgi:hypothetical protein